MASGVGQSQCRNETTTSFAPTDNPCIGSPASATPVTRPKIAPRNPSSATANPQNGRDRRAVSILPQSSARARSHATINNGRTTAASLVPNVDDTATTAPPYQSLLSHTPPIAGGSTAARS